MKRERGAVLALVCLQAAAWAVFPPPVKDEAKFFKPATVEKADAKIREIYQKHHKDVVVETLAALTAEQEKAFKEDGKEKFFAKLAASRVKALGVNGVYVLVCKKPQYLRIDMDPGTRKSAFTNADRDKMFKKIAASFKEDDFDAGLLAGLDLVEATLKSGKK